MTNHKDSIVKINKVKYLRDLGGVSTCDGRVVKKGLIFRSSDLSKTNEKSEKMLFDDLGIKNVVDLRSPSEKKEMPESVPENVQYFDYPTLSDYENPAVTRKTQLKILKNTMNSEGGAIGHLSRNYRVLVSSEDAIEYYRGIFKILLKGEGGTLYHCTQGKDRTGMVSILILLVLGADYDSIKKDYYYFNKTRRIKNALIYLAIMVFLFSCRKAYALYCFLTTRKEYLEAALDELITKFESVDNYIHNVIGLTDEDILKLKDMYLVKEAQ